jgi:hypothetical protein
LAAEESSLATEETADKVCTMTVASGVNANCSYAASSDSKITGGVKGQNILVNNDPWNAKGSNYEQTVTATSPSKWQAIASVTDPGLAVHSYPDTDVFMSGTIDSHTSIKTSWNVTIPTSPKEATGWAAYDLWFNNYKEEVMIRVEVTQAGISCSAPVATATFNNEVWHLCTYGNGEKAWSPGVSDKSTMGKSSGSLDIMPFLTWLEAHDYISKNSTWTVGEFGFEICNTDGKKQTFAVNNYSWHVENADDAETSGSATDTDHP